MILKGLLAGTEGNNRYSGRYLLPNCYQLAINQVGRWAGRAGTAQLSSRSNGIENLFALCIHAGPDEARSRLSMM
jgi:hypothetical protein